MRPPALRSLAAALALPAALAACATGRPPWRADGELTAVDVFAFEGHDHRVLRDRATLDELAACLSRARRDDQRHHQLGTATYRLGLSGTGKTWWFLPQRATGASWMFSPTTGKLSKLQMKASPVYWLDEPDRARVVALLAPRASPARPAEQRRLPPHPRRGAFPWRARRSSAASALVMRARCFTAST